MNAFWQPEPSREPIGLGDPRLDEAIPLEHPACGTSITGCGRRPLRKRSRNGRGEPAGRRPDIDPPRGQPIRDPPDGVW